MSRAPNPATEPFAAAVDALVADDAAAVTALLDGTPGLVRQTLAEERFVTAIVHQVYAGDTLLHVAAAGFRAAMVETLLAAGADIHARNRRGATALHYAADTNHDDDQAQAATIAVLLKAGADPDARDKGGTAPLHRAVRTRGVAAVRALLDGGADAALRNGGGSSPLDLAQWTTGRGGTGLPDAKAAQGKIIRLLEAAIAA